ncbi:MAG: tRNA (adenine-N1)-methyltransferase, partial [Thermoplasmata archaeon]|nr:tRNA (adenine-N1)-methyltransferase [Thermoplasmata archaeon]
GGDGFLVRLITAPQMLEGRGVLDLTPMVGKAPGSPFDWAGTTYRVLRPSLADILTHLRRKAQIITPKDAQYLLYLAGIRPGGSVVEAGAGSGALTVVLAYFVGPTGRVTSYDRRDDFLEVARRNVSAGGLGDRVEFRQRDVASVGFDVEAVDSVVLDLPEPWAVLRAAHSVLRVGGYVAAYTPTYNQLERTVREMRQNGFEEVHSLELLERPLHVGEGGTRPDFEMLGHTGFLTGGRRGE